MKTENERPKQDIIEFLCGAGTYDGYQWQEATRDKRPHFWWRTKLREHVGGLQSRVSDLEREKKNLSDEKDKAYGLMRDYMRLSDEKTEVILNRNEEIKRLEKEVEELREKMKKEYQRGYGAAQFKP